DAGFRLLFMDDPYGGSDQQSFFLAGVPVLFFFTGKHAEYHTPADTENTIDRPGEARVVALVRRCVERIAADGARPEFRDFDPTLPLSSRAFGVLPDYGSDDPAGFAVARTVAGSAARRAGVLPGDVITAFAGHTIRSFHDLRIVVTDVADGETVPVRVLRGGREITLTATVGAPGNTGAAAGSTR
ncbi:MAG TPA: PDZ domain-containing protein, partial [Thermoanaerobaculia bacterium]|nr:PDZ domain-containing protein [Thermoanaerobaculia bacterium]